MSKFRDWSYDDLRSYVMEHRHDKGGLDCMVCDQHAEVYRRSINNGMARASVLMYRAHGGEWMHKPTVLRGVGAAARDEALLRFWGILEEDPERNGWWRLPLLGQEWVTGRTRVRLYQNVYNGLPYGEPYGPLVSVQDCLPRGFDIDDIRVQTVPAPGVRRIQRRAKEDEAP